MTSVSSVEPTSKGKVGYFCSYFPKEIVYAFGRTAVRVVPRAGRAGADAYLPKNFCSLVKVTLASFLRDGASDLESVVFVNSCDAYRRMHDVWREYIGIEVLGFLDVPRRNTSLAHERFGRALQRLVEGLEKRYDQPLTAEALGAAVRAYSRQRELWREVGDQWAQGSLSSQAYLDLRHYLLAADPEEVNKRLLEALEKSQGEAADPARGPRILLIGSLVVNESLVEAIEGAGGQVVAEESCAGGRQLRESPRDSGGLEGILQDLAAKYLAKPPCPRMRDLPARLAHLFELLEGKRVDGVICSYYKFCDLFLSEYPILRRALVEGGYPVLFLEDEGESGLSGQNRTRVEAFLEVLR